MRTDEPEVRAALARLGALLNEVTSAVEAQAPRRCPYKTTELRCTFRGQCASQQQQGSATRCAGGEFSAQDPA